MESFSMGLGILLGLGGPLLLLPITWAVYKLIAKPFINSRLKLKQQDRAFAGVLISIGLVISIVTLSYLPGKMQFKQLCEKHTTPQVSQRVVAEGFFNADLVPYEADDFLSKSGFVYVEGRDTFEQNGYVRHSKDENGNIVEQKIAAPSSPYRVEKTHSELSFTNRLDETVIYDSSTGTELGRAGSVTYHGGPLGYLLGFAAISSCPDIMMAEGARDFRIYHRLEEYVLRSAELK